jgi:hypothetical protein
MNIRIKIDKANDLGRICKEMKMNPSQVMEYLLDIVQNLYSDFEREKNAEVKEESFEEILTNLFSHSFKSKLRTLNIAEKLIEGTNELLGIKEYVGAAIHNINPDFDNRSISYLIGYDFCVDAANMYAYKSLLIEVEINRDYIEVSHVVYLPTFENMNITDKEVNTTSDLVQEFFKDVYREEFSPFANIEIKILPIRVNPYNLSEPIQSIGIKLIIKTEKAENIPSIEKIGLFAREVHAIIVKELVTREV